MSLKKEDMNSKPLENGTPNSSPFLGRSTPTISPKRLPSFKPPRDLTLGLPKSSLALAAKPRKKFTPNIPARRDKSNDIAEQKPAEDNSRQGSRGRRGKWEARGGRGGGGCPSRRNKPIFIQTAGSVFGEGIGEATKRHHHDNAYSHSREDSGSAVVKTKLNLERHQQVDKKEEELKLQALLNCDFVDDPSSAPDERFRPISLPLLQERKIFKKEAYEDKVKTENIKEEDDKGILEIKTEPSWEDSKDIAVKNCVDNKVFVKEEPKSGDEEEFEEKPKPRVNPTPHIRGPNEYSVMELLDHSKKAYVLLQLPTCLPGPKPDIEDTGKQNKAPSTSGSSSDCQTSSGNVEDVSEQLQDCTLRSLPEGHIGTLRIHESGKTMILLNGGYDLVANPGTQVGFLQEIVSVDLDESKSTGKMFVLGPARSALNCTPDLESLILSSEDWDS